MSLTPIMVLLSEAPLSLRRSLLANWFNLRNFCWNNSRLAKKLEDLASEARVRTFKVNSDKCGLLSAYDALGAFVGAMYCSSRPGYFVDLGSNLLAEIPVDRKSGKAFKDFPLLRGLTCLHRQIG